MLATLATCSYCSVTVRDPYHTSTRTPPPLHSVAVAALTSCCNRRSIPSAGVWVAVLVHSSRKA
jgi:hypothetical protein